MFIIHWLSLPTKIQTNIKCHRIWVFTHRQALYNGCPIICPIPESNSASNLSSSDMLETPRGITSPYFVELVSFGPPTQNIFQPSHHRHPTTLFSLFRIRAVNCTKRKGHYCSTHPLPSIPISKKNAGRRQAIHPSHFPSHPLKFSFATQISTSPLTHTILGNSIP